MPPPYRKDPTPKAPRHNPNLGFRQDQLLDDRGRIGPEYVGPTEPNRADQPARYYHNIPVVVDVVTGRLERDARDPSVANSPQRIANATAQSREDRESEDRATDILDLALRSPVGRLLHATRNPRAALRELGQAYGFIDEYRPVDRSTAPRMVRVPTAAETAVRSRPRRSR